MPTRNPEILSSLQDRTSSILEVLDDIISILGTNNLRLNFETLVDGLTVSPITVYRGQSVGRLPVPIRDGYDFVGWFINYRQNPLTGKETFSNEIENYSTASFSTSLTLYAKWEPTVYEIQLNPMSGTVSQQYIKVPYLGKFGKLPIPKKGNSGFTRWYDLNKNTVEEGTQLSWFGDPISAEYYPLSFVLSLDYLYNPNVEVTNIDDGFSPTSVLLQADRPYSLVGDSMKAQQYLSAPGYVFCGWSEMKNNPGVIPGIKIWDDTTLYAYWKPLEYKTKYVLSNGTILTADSMVYGIPDGAYDAENLFDYSTASYLSMWNHSHDWNVSPCILSAGDMPQNHYFMNIISSDRELSVFYLSAGFLEDPRGLIPKKIVKISCDNNYHYVLGDDIFASAFRVLVKFFDYDYRWRIPTRFSPPLIENSPPTNIEPVTSTITAYYDDDDDISITFDLSGSVPEIVIAYDMLTAENSPVSAYEIEDYPDFGNFAIQTTTNFGNKSIDYNYYYEPNEKFVQVTDNGEFHISAMSQDLKTCLCAFEETLPYRVTERFSHYELSTEYRYPGQPTVNPIFEGRVLETGGKIHVLKYYMDGNYDEVVLDPFWFSPVISGDSEEVLETWMDTITISNGEPLDERGFSFSYPIEVLEDVGTLTLSTLPYKMVYRIGEDLNLSGLTGKIKYENLPTVILSGDENGEDGTNFISYSGDFTTKGISQVPVFYDGVRENLSVLVADKFLKNTLSVLIPSGTGFEKYGFSFQKHPSDFTGSGSSSLEYDGTPKKRIVLTADVLSDDGNYMEYLDTAVEFNTEKIKNVTHDYSKTQEDYYVNVNIYSDFSGILSANPSIQFAGSSPWVGIGTPAIVGNVPVSFMKNVSSNSQFKTVTIKSTKDLPAKNIGDYAWLNNTKIEHVNFDPSGEEIPLEKIGDQAFMNASYFKSFNSDDEGIYKFPPHLKHIGISAFANAGNSSSGFKTIDLSNCLSSLEYVGDCAFAYNDTISSIIFGTSDKSDKIEFGTEVFKLCKNLISVDGFPNISAVAPGMFLSCLNLEYVYLPNSVKLIDQSGFDSTSISLLSGGENIRSIGQWGFVWSKLLSIDLKNVESIGIGALGHCRNLLSVNFGENLKSIGDRAFDQDYYLSCLLPHYSGIDEFDEEFVLTNSWDLRHTKLETLGWCCFRGMCLSAGNIDLIILPNNSNLKIDSRAFALNRDGSDPQEVKRINAIYIPSGVQNYANDSFENVTSIYFEGVCPAGFHPPEPYIIIENAVLSSVVNLFRN